MSAVRGFRPSGKGRRAGLGKQNLTIELGASSTDWPFQKLITTTRKTAKFSLIALADVCMVQQDMYACQTGQR
jgi:hypothetical protein